MREIFLFLLIVVINGQIYIDSNIGLDTYASIQFITVFTPK